MLRPASPLRVRQYGDELFAVVKGFESRHSLTGYAPRREYCQYVMGYMLDFCYDRWDRLHTGKPQQIPVITKISHPRVFYYSDDISGMLVSARQLDVKYDVDDVEIIEASEQSVMISYVLGFEGGKWKV